MKQRIYILLSVLLISTGMIAQSGPGGTPTSPKPNGYIGLDPTVTPIPFNPAPVDPSNNNDAPDGENPRKVFWVYGLNGDQYSWSRAAHASQWGGGPGFPGRKLKSIEQGLDYHQETDMRIAGGHLNNQMDHFHQPGDDPSRSFIIAHSQGGIATRSASYVAHCPGSSIGVPYGGFVTFGTPNQGARILNNADDFNDLLTDMCAGLSEGPLKEFIDGIDNITFRLGKIVFQKDLELWKLVDTGTVREFCENTSNFFFPLIKHYQVPPITNDYQVGSAWLNTLESCENEDYKNMPKIAFYGEEPEQALMLRTMQWMLGDVNGEDFFQANDDDLLIEQGQENYMKYLDKVMQYQQMYDRYSGFYHRNKCYTLIPQVPWWQCQDWKSEMNKYKSFVEAYQRGVDFFNSMDDRYKLVIGALEIETVTEEECWRYNVLAHKGSSHWEYLYTLTPGSPPCGPQHPGDLNEYEVRTKTVVRRTTHPSDGVVLVSSASDLPDATFPPQRMPNSSHMQMRNDENTKFKLLDLYEGRLDPFFETAEN